MRAAGTRAEPDVSHADRFPGGQPTPFREGLRSTGLKESSLIFKTHCLRSSSQKGCAQLQQTVLSLHCCWTLCPGWALPWSTGCGAPGSPPSSLHLADLLSSLSRGFSMYHMGPGLPPDGWGRLESVLGYTWHGACLTCALREPKGSPREGPQQSQSAAGEDIRVSVSVQVFISSFKSANSKHLKTCVDREPAARTQDVCESVCLGEPRALSRLTRRAPSRAGNGGHWLSANPAGPPTVLASTELGAGSRGLLWGISQAHAGSTVPRPHCPCCASQARPQRCERHAEGLCGRALRVLMELRAPEKPHENGAWS